MPRSLKLLTFLLVSIILKSCNLPAGEPLTPFPRPEILQFVRSAVDPLDPDYIPPEQALILVDDLVAGVSPTNLINAVGALSSVHSRHFNNPGAAQAAAIIFEHFQAAGGRLVVGREEFELDYEGTLTRQENVIARLPGSDPFAGIIVIGAHYDSRSEDVLDATSAAPGANDNASGVAAIIEIARLLANETPIATIDLVAFAAEEIGTKGSQHYIQSALERGETIRGALILDIIGNGDGVSGRGAIRAFSSPPDSSISRQLARWLGSVAQVYTPELTVQVQSRLDRPGRWSDHVPFTRVGIPSVRLIEAKENVDRQHNALDLPGFLDPEYLGLSTQLTLAAVINLAWGFELPSP